MQANTIKISKSKTSKRIGRGGKKGTYSGSGMKGQKSRSGYSRRATFEGGRTSLSAKTKKVRGFKAIKKAFQVVSLAAIDKKFKNGEEVTPQSLKERNLVSKDYVPTKILLGKPFSAKLIFSGVACSKTAAEAIKKSGGEIK